jgi:hypothetical protein
MVANMEDELQLNGPPNNNNNNNNNSNNTSAYETTNFLEYVFQNYGKSFSTTMYWCFVGV